MMREHRIMRSISRAFKVLLVIAAVPLAAIAGLVSAIFGLKAKLSPSEVASYLRNFVDGDGGDWDWDDFTSVPIADPKLEDIRRGALDVGLPLTEDGSATLRGLLAEAEQLERREPES